MISVHEVGLWKGLLQLHQGQHGDMINSDLPFGDPQFLKGGDEFLLDLFLHDPGVLHRRQGTNVLFLHPVHRVPAPFVTPARGKQDGFFIRRHDACVSGEKRDRPPQGTIPGHVAQILRLET